MNTNFIPRLSLTEVSNPFKADFTGHVRKIQMPDDVQGPTFKDAMSNLVETVNTTMSTPDTLMKEAMTGGTVDVHDVMIANAKAELLVNITSQVATKVVQAYDRILQIQI